MSGAYYNENDKATAEWLRQLIKDGEIADGEVDTRSIVEVKASEVRRFTQCHFFAGIGGWSYALRLAGWSDQRRVWSGSCPCQPWSGANVWRDRRGEDDERHLWPAWFRLIDECRPGVVFGEQVANKDGRRWFDQVSDDMEGAGYAIGAVDLCATAFRPQRRQRLFFVADASCSGLQRLSGHGDGVEESRRESAPAAGPMRHADLWGGVSFLRCRDGRDRPIPLADGISEGVDSGRANHRPDVSAGERRALIIHGFGNAIVPQVAAAFVSSFMDLRLD